MRLVDADKIRWKSYPNDYGETNDDYVGKCDIDNMPTVDAVPVVHGRWLDNRADGYKWAFICSRCGYVDGHPFGDRHNFCPNCGAKMENDEDGGKNHDD